MKTKTFPAPTVTQYSHNPKTFRNDIPNELEITVGMGMGGHYPNDTYAFEVVEIKSDKKIVIREMTAKISPDFKPEMIVGGFCAHCTNNHEQKWDITSNPDGRLMTLTKRKNGSWDVEGSKTGQGMRFSFGKAVYFHDYNL